MAAQSELTTPPIVEHLNQEAVVVDFLGVDIPIVVDIRVAEGPSIRIIRTVGHKVSGEDEEAMAAGMGMVAAEAATSVLSNTNNSSHIHPSRRASRLLNSSSSIRMLMVAKDRVLDLMINKEDTSNDEGLFEKHVVHCARRIMIPTAWSLHWSISEAFRTRFRCIFVSVGMDLLSKK